MKKYKKIVAVGLAVMSASQVAPHAFASKFLIDPKAFNTTAAPRLLVENTSYNANRKNVCIVDKGGNVYKDYSTDNDLESIKNDDLSWVDQSLSNTYELIVSPVYSQSDGTYLDVDTYKKATKLFYKKLEDKLLTMSDEEVKQKLPKLNKDSFEMISSISKESWEQDKDPALLQKANEVMTPEVNTLIENFKTKFNVPNAGRKYYRIYEALNALKDANNNDSYYGENFPTYLIKRAIKNNELNKETIQKDFDTINEFYNVIPNDRKLKYLNEFENTLTVNQRVKIVEKIKNEIEEEKGYTPISIDLIRAIESNDPEFAINSITYIEKDGQYFAKTSDLEKITSLCTSDYIRYGRHRNAIIDSNGNATIFDTIKHLPNLERIDLLKYSHPDKNATRPDEIDLNTMYKTMVDDLLTRGEEEYKKYAPHLDLNTITTPIGLNGNDEKEEYFLTVDTDKQDQIKTNIDLVKNRCLNNIIIDNETHKDRINQILNEKVSNIKKGVDKEHYYQLRKKELKNQYEPEVKNAIKDSITQVIDEDLDAKIKEKETEITNGEYKNKEDVKTHVNELKENAKKAINNSPTYQDKKEELEKQLKLIDKYLKDQLEKDKNGTISPIVIPGMNVQPSNNNNTSSNNNDTSIINNNNATSNNYSSTNSNTTQTKDVKDPKVSINIEKIKTAVKDKALTIKNLFNVDPLNKRLYGQNRYLTAISVENDIFNEKPDAVILVNSDKYSDALTATPLAKTLNAAILFTNKDYVQADTLKEIKRIKPKQIIVIGGKDTISDNVKSLFKKDNVITINGHDRYDTSYKIAQMIRDVNKKDSMIIASGENYSDALSASAINNGVPILLTRKDKLPKSTYNFIKDPQNGINKIDLIGGEHAIDKNVFNEVSKLKNVERIAGQNRYETSAKIAKKYFKDSQYNIYVNGDSFSDALVAGALSDKYKAPVVLIKNGEVPQPIQKYIGESNPKNLIVVGGENTISDYTVRLLFNEIYK